MISDSLLTPILFNISYFISVERSGKVVLDKYRHIPTLPSIPGIIDIYWKQNF